MKKLKKKCPHCNKKIRWWQSCFKDASGRILHLPCVYEEEVALGFISKLDATKVIRKQSTKTE